MRPISLAIENSRLFAESTKNCVGDRTETEVMLQWLLDYARLFRDRRFFGFSWVTRLTHDTPNLLHATDRYYYEFLRDLKDSGVLENTVIVFLSDHGLRFGDILETYVGKLEERLPVCYVVLPQQLRRMYPHLARNVQTNTRRLTSPFDVYETLKHLLHFDDTERTADTSERGISVFYEIPLERTCSDAGIAPHWCTCQVHTPVSIADPIVVRCARFVISVINEMLSPQRNSCILLDLKNVTDCMMSSVNDAALRLRKEDRLENDITNKKLRFGRRTVTMVDYLITVKATPGGGLFEATVRHNEEMDTFEKMGEISRINKYQGQSDCVESPRLQKYCFCRNL